MSNAVASRIATARAATSANYARPGRYRFEVLAMKAKDGFKGLSAIAELKVLSAKATEPGVEPSKVGSVVSFVENVSDAKKGGGGRFKTFLLNLIDADESALEAPTSTAKFLDERQAGTFLIIEADVWTKHLPERDGKPGKDIEAFRWSPVVLTDAELGEVEKKRMAHKLKPLKEALTDA